MPSVAKQGFLDTVLPYLQIARIDHWFKNTFMLLGIVLAYFYMPDHFSPDIMGKIVAGFLATCIVASSNYVINELLDAPLDRFHPTKKFRPAAAGKIRSWIALVEWLVLAVLGIALAYTINLSFAVTAFTLWIMGCIYNIPPVRSKEITYLDVLSESVNNPLRLLLGWFILIPDHFPSLSLLLAYWMAGAFFMATKRFAEYRAIGDSELAAKYRRSFAGYSEDKLLVSMVFYVTTCTLFLGAYIIRYKLELIISIPVIAGFFSYYMVLGLKENSPVQNPEKLYRERGFLAYAILTTVVFIGLMVIEIPALYEMLGVDASRFEPLWKISNVR